MVCLWGKIQSKWMIWGIYTIIIKYIYIYICIYIIAVIHICFFFPNTRHHMSSDNNYDVDLLCSLSADVRVCLLVRSSFFFLWNPPIPIFGEHWRTISIGVKEWYIYANMNRVFVDGKWQTMKIWHTLTDPSWDIYCCQRIFYGFPWSSRQYFAEI